MAALVVLAVALTALLSAQAGAVRLRSQAAEITFAAFLAQARMTDVELGEFPDVGTREGDFGDAYPGYRWQLAVTETPFPKVREIRLAVLWRAGPREERLELTHFLVDPK
jgi:Tfp pilus assembly protein PilV